jgi:hypothetical protein
MVRYATACGVATLVAFGSALFVVSEADAAATGVHCRSVHAGHYKATHVFVDFMRCRDARSKLRKWLKRGHLPRHHHGWYCHSLGSPVRECSYPGKKHASRDFTFWLYRVS